MNAEEIINFIATSEKKTPVKVYVREKPGQKVNYKANAAKGEVKVFGGRKGKIVFGDWADIKPVLEANADAFDYYEVENDCRNSAVPMLDMKEINARIEPGAIIRDQVEIGDNAVIMMGAVINIGAVIGEGTMIDMGVVLGGRAIVGKHCHIGAGTVLAGGRCCRWRSREGHQDEGCENRGQNCSGRRASHALVFQCGEVRSFAEYAWPNGKETVKSIIIHNC